jgi:hypothetical protein
MMVCDRQIKLKETDKVKRRIIGLFCVLIISLGAFTGCVTQKVQACEDLPLEGAVENGEPVSVDLEERTEEGAVEKEDVAGIRGQEEAQAPEAEENANGEEKKQSKTQPAEPEPVEPEPAVEEPVIEEPVVETPVEEPAAAAPENSPVDQPLVPEEPVEPEATPVELEPEAVVTEAPIQIAGSFGDLFIKEQVNLVKSPDTVEEFKDVLLYMCLTDTFTYSIEYRGIGFEELLTSETQGEIAEAFDQAFNTYPEYFSFSNRMTYKATGGDDKVTITFTLSSDTGMDAATLIRYRKEFFNESVEIVENLQAEGKLSSSQSDRDKALVLYEWVIGKAEYDYNYHPESYTGYGVYENGLGVCQGYTAAYNALCKIVGLDVEGVGGTADGVDHIWTRANFAGSNVFIDATWGDSYVNSDKVNYDYFLISGNALSATHNWQ